MASIEGGNNSVSGVQGGQNGSNSDAVSAAEMARDLINDSTGPLGVDTDRLAANVDFAMRSMPSEISVTMGLSRGVSASALESAVIAQLGAREQGQLQASLDRYSSNLSVGPAQRLAMDAPFRVPTGQPGMNTAQDPYGTEVPSEYPRFSMSSTDTAAYRLAEAQRQQRADGMRQVELITSGPFSGLFAAGGVIAGAEMHTIEGLAKVGEMVDGFTAPWSP